MTKEAALKIAEEEGLDLVEVSAQSGVSICKLMNYDKYLYEMKKKQKENKSNSKKEILKEIKFGNNIAEHDLHIKANKAQELLTDGCKVKVCVVYKGREKERIYEGKSILEKFLGYLTDKHIEVVKLPKIEGNMYTVELKKEHK